MSVQANRAIQVRTGVRIEIFTVIWMVVEAAVSIGAGILAGSALLNTLFHWWWAEDIAALVFLFFLVAETHEALEEARGEKDDDDD